MSQRRNNPPPPQQAPIIPYQSPARAAHPTYPQQEPATGMPGPKKNPKRPSIKLTALPQQEYQHQPQQRFQNQQQHPQQQQFQNQQLQQFMQQQPGIGFFPLHYNNYNDNNYNDSTYNNDTYTDDNYNDDNHNYSNYNYLPRGYSSLPRTPHMNQLNWYRPANTNQNLPPLPPSSSANTEGKSGSNYPPEKSAADKPKSKTNSKKATIRSSPRGRVPNCTFTPNFLQGTASVTERILLPHSTWSPEGRKMAEEFTIGKILGCLKRKTHGGKFSISTASSNLWLGRNTGVNVCGGGGERDSTCRFRQQKEEAPEDIRSENLPSTYNTRINPGVIRYNVAEKVAVLTPSATLSREGKFSLPVSSGASSFLIGESRV